VAKQAHRAVEKFINPTGKAPPSNATDDFAPTVLGNWPPMEIDTRCSDNIASAKVGNCGACCEAEPTLLTLFGAAAEAEG
jgi:hypothetical protein